MKIKKGDKVKILTGKDRGKTGKVLQVFTRKNRISVEGLNLSIKHMRPRKQGEKGQRIEFPAPISAANLMLVCPKCGKATRVGYQYIEIKGNAANPAAADTGAAVKGKRKKIRVCKKCRQTVD
ncbi:MAG: 50S ribosomal protein L24 [Planctomycetes bacterium]|jgi:large subunit ribosomal protein L24|nr:50S ribosomal protein L24 [Planctomycetota bacterium]